MNQIGIMQGRLSVPVGGRIQAFPWGSWKEEFYRASDCGFDLIDWIIEAHRIDENPLLTDDGVKKIKKLQAETGVEVSVVCADYFMDCPLLRCSDNELKQRMDFFILLLNRLNDVGISYLEMPFVDNSAIHSQEELNRLIEIMGPLLERARRAGVTLAFETSLSPDMFRSFLLEMNHPAAWANYDMGNSASLGYEPAEEIKAYGQHIVTVHVKDRVLGGGTVALGTGDTDFDTCFSMLTGLGYNGPYILQVARGDDEISWCKKNKEFIMKYLLKRD